MLFTSRASSSAAHFSPLSLLSPLLEPLLTFSKPFWVSRYLILTPRAVWSSPHPGSIYKQGSDTGQQEPLQDKMHCCASWRPLWTFLKPNTSHADTQMCKNRLGRGRKRTLRLLGMRDLRWFCSQCRQLAHPEFNPQHSALWFLMSCYYWEHEFLLIYHIFCPVLHLTGIWKEQLQGGPDKHLATSNSKPSSKNKWKTMTLLGKTEPQISL